MSKIIDRIIALLNKTVENGATPAEMDSAMAKAHSLMVENFITEADLRTGQDKNEFVFRTIKPYRTNNKISIYYGSLAQFVDCKMYYTERDIRVFGTQSDTELFEYFYNFIIINCMAAKSKYLKNEVSEEHRAKFHGRTIANTFIKGYLLGVSRKLIELYNSRSTQMDARYVVMLVKKSDLVNAAFQEATSNIKFRNETTRIQHRSRDIFNDALNEGQKINLSRGIGQSTTMDARLLN